MKKDIIEKNAQSISVENFKIDKEPFYISTADEINIFEQAYISKIPVLLKGPTGSGKTRFVEYMSWKLQKNKKSAPLITVACHEDLTASDLVGRYLIENQETKWIDGPITRAVKIGAICYLDEIVEARKDTTVLIHPLTDYRRLLPIDKKGEIIEAHDGFLLVLSYNPGYQSITKDLKHSTRQRFVSIEFDYPNQEIETKIILNESGCDDNIAERLAQLAVKIRNLREYGLAEGVSTRLLIYAALLIKAGISPITACISTVVWSLTDEKELQDSIEELVRSIFVS
ncbi:MAG: CbbQ/NirQ/NorQ/GpvN family protein [Dehalococcoidia bacterium]|jgi:nitric oxide reductase NorQ protein|nr:MAG: nitric oxide reductase NorQ protein [Chloroflexota bacterium]|tara:strand:- start:6221 stop:7075 length:855 start_codon:yes stop_codon:yes gene_type:complete